MADEQHEEPPRWQRAGRRFVLLGVLPALVLLAGRYTGYRLTELLRFKDLAS